ncbi:unnamed protein product [Pleuronectes platessa]|uniref:Uncharacterized protein n=1 Tax=Pleuronectes platessa TaxID=8262 RepID=A0A9N7UEK6_PLEPL|nr:unnamed protein product [Pleuronectes platessa]
MVTVWSLSYINTRNDVCVLSTSAFNVTSLRTEEEYVITWFPIELVVAKNDVIASLCVNVPTLSTKSLITRYKIVHAELRLTLISQTEVNASSIPRGAAASKINSSRSIVFRYNCVILFIV